MAHRTFSKLGYREGLMSLGIFSALLFMLTTFDPRVRDKLADMFHTGNVSPFGDRFSDLTSALWSALRYQSIENAPLLVFTTVGAVLTIFMFRS
jgi:hypothetical protein